jgi:hypothetical protein
MVGSPQNQTTSKEMPAAPPPLDAPGATGQQPARPGDQQPGHPQPPSGYGPYAADPNRRPGWATAIGIISICVGSYYALSLVCTPIALVFQRLIMAHHGMQNTIAQTMPPWYLPVVLTMSAIAGIGGVILLIGGVKLLKRRPAAITWHMVYALLLIVVAVAQAIQSVALTAHMAANMPAHMQKMMRPFTGIGAVFGLLWTCAYPVFCLVWFNRRKTKDAIARWRTTAQSHMRPWRGGP